MFKILEEEKAGVLTVALMYMRLRSAMRCIEEYKGRGKPMADELRQQVPVIKEVLKGRWAFRIIERAGLEANDLIEPCQAMRAEGNGRYPSSPETRISTAAGDRAGEDPHSPKTKQGRTEVEDYYAQDVRERYQVTPQSLSA